MDTVFFVLSKVLPALLYPLPLVLIILMIAALGQKGKGRRKLLLFLPPALLWILSTPAVLTLTVQAWEEPLADPGEVTEFYDAAVVLGGLSWPELSSPAYTEFTSRPERLLVPLELYHRGKVGKILITSGSGSLMNQVDREADALGTFALRWGVKPEDLLIERESRNTFENAALSKPLLDAAGAKKVLLVTSAFHMKRSLAIFTKLGIEVTPLAVDTLTDPTPLPFNLIPDPRALQDFQVLLKEIVGYAAYKAVGYL